MSVCVHEQPHIDAAQLSDCRWCSFGSYFYELVTAVGVVNHLFALRMCVTQIQSDTHSNIRTHFFYHMTAETVISSTDWYTFIYRSGIFVLVVFVSILWPYVSMARYWHTWVTCTYRTHIIDNRRHHFHHYYDYLWRRWIELNVIYTRNTLLPTYNEVRYLFGIKRNVYDIWW